ncbi:hypothetical protein YC2023_067482 [Brassica napus]
MRYMTQTSLLDLNLFWTNKEDAPLRELVDGFGSNVQWTTVASIMNRPFNSCKSIYEFLLMNLGDLMPTRINEGSSGSTSKKQLKTILKRKKISGN